jgi:hypothetical protein
VFIPGPNYEIPAAMESYGERRSRLFYPLSLQPWRRPRAVLDKRAKYRRSGSGNGGVTCREYESEEPQGAWRVHLFVRTHQ